MCLTQTPNLEILSLNIDRTTATTKHNNGNHINKNNTTHTHINNDNTTGNHANTE